MFIELAYSLLTEVSCILIVNFNLLLELCQWCIWGVEHLLLVLLLRQPVV